MSKFELIPFSEFSDKNFKFEAELTPTKESIFISYHLFLSSDQIDLGNNSPNKVRTLKLWEKTCFELFIKNSNDQYIEFNFSPTFEWNCFYFNKKGDPLNEFLKMPMPKIDILNSLNKFSLFAEISKTYFPDDFFTNSMNVGISSVIKLKNNELSYWAITHKDHRPNFHHFDSFICKF